MLLALNVNISSVTPSFYDLKSSTLDSFYELGVGGPANIHKSAYASIIGRSGDILNLTMKVVKKARYLQGVSSLANSFQDYVGCFVCMRVCI